MLLCHEGSLQAYWLDSRRSDALAGRSAALMDYFERPKLAVDVRRNTDVS